MSEPRTAILAGSGIYELADLEHKREMRTDDTPFGPPSSPVILGQLEGQEVAFLARHGIDHRLLPSEINSRANIFTLKSIGVQRVVSVSAVGSMREEIRPRDIVLVDQFIDRTAHRAATFFGDGIAAHVSFADPVCPEMKGVLVQGAKECGLRTHDGGTYVCVEGPAFSTRAESRLFRSWGVDVVGMTNIQEAKLAREAEMCYATIALVTDYDCWHDDEEDVSVGNVLEHLTANQRAAVSLLRRCVGTLTSAAARCRCSESLRDAIITPRSAISAGARDRLRPILGKYLDGSS